MTPTYSTTSTTNKRGLLPSGLSIVLCSTELTSLKPVRVMKRQWPSGMIHVHSLAFYKKPCRSTWKTIHPQRRRSKNSSHWEHSQICTMIWLYSLMWTSLRTILTSSVFSSQTSIRKFSLQQKLLSTTTSTIHKMLQSIMKTRSSTPYRSWLVKSNYLTRRKRCRGQRTHSSCW